MKLENQIDELLQREVITADTATNIKAYFEQKRQKNPNAILVTFGIIGAVLGSLGIILILAHNWDNLSVFVKSIVAFLPLVLGQFLCGYSLFRKKGNIVWSESSAAFLFIAIGACISLISQTYHIEGDLPSFLLTWMLLGLPLIYLMRSSAASFLFIVGITYYAVAGQYGWNRSGESYYYWLLILGVLPHFFRLHKMDASSNFLTINYWILSLSLIITLGTVAHKTEILMYLGYLSLFGVLYNFGKSEWMTKRSLFANGPRVIGALGILIILFVFSFEFIWSMMRISYWGYANIDWSYAYYSPEFVFCVILSIIALALLFLRHRKVSWTEVRPMSLIPFVVMPVFALGYYWSYSQLIINLLILALAIIIIVEGAKKDHLGILNKGLTIIMLLTIFKFFDQNLSFVLKGIIFMVVGSGFFIANYLVVKKRKNKLN